MEFTADPSAMAGAILVEERIGRIVPKLEASGLSASLLAGEASGGLEEGKLNVPLNIPAWLLTPAGVVGAWIAHHWRIMRTGESPHVHVECSIIVAMSSMLYLAVAYCYWLQLCPFMTVMFCLVTITSLFSDSLCPSSKTWCSLDRTLATSGVFFGPLRAAFFYADGPLEQFMIFALSIFSILFLAWSRQSKCQNDFVLRHTCWHIVSATCLMWLAFNVPPIHQQ